MRLHGQQCVNAIESDLFFLFFVFCHHSLKAALIFYPLHLPNVQYLLRPSCCSVCCNHNACPDLTALIPPAVGSEVRVSLLAGTFYLIKVQSKWNLRNTMIWSRSALCYCISDVLWLWLPGSRKSEETCALYVLLTGHGLPTIREISAVNTVYWQHIANIVNSNKNIINHWRQGQVCTREEDMALLVCIQSERSNATRRRKKMVAD